MKNNTFGFATPLICLLFLLPVTLAQADVGGPYGEYYMAYSGPETLTLMVTPDGSGLSFDEAFLPWGDTEDATITLELKNANWEPVANFPREDLWLESHFDGLIPCVGGTIADSNTDAFGITWWQDPVFGGGSSEPLTVVLVNGSPIELTSGVNLRFNSPDINGDLVVNLVDVALFASDFFGAYHFRADLYRDGVINLQDLATFAQAFGTSCP